MADIPREKKIRLLWVFISVGYGLCRVLLASTFLADYGLQPRVFASIELISSMGYGWASGAFVLAFLSEERLHLRRLLATTVVSYLASDIYVLTFANRMPTRVLVGVVSWTVGALIVSVAVMRGRVATKVT